MVLMVHWVLMVLMDLLDQYLLYRLLDLFHQMVPMDLLDQWVPFHQYHQ